jgi:hypothetical protein
MVSMRPAHRVSATLIAVVLLFIGAALLASQDTQAHGSMEVYKSPTCGCCDAWIEIMESSWFQIDVHEVDDVTAVKHDWGIPAEMASCHTTIVDGYFIEGHVPAKAITRLLEERPDFDGIAVPGMPAGSPGMGGQASGPLKVYAVAGGEVFVWMTV